MNHARFVNEWDDILFYTTPRDNKELGIQIGNRYFEADVKVARLMYDYIKQFLQENNNEGL